MWTPLPGSALRYAGSVATRVLPSPVAISAILPWWSTMPPISWTSKWRMPTVRRAASRHHREGLRQQLVELRAVGQALAELVGAARGGPSSDERPAVPASSALMSATTGPHPLDVALVLGAEDLAEDRDRSCQGLILHQPPRPAAQALGVSARLQELAGVPAGRLGDPLAAQHAGHLVHPRRRGQRARPSCAWRRAPRASRPRRCWAA